MKFMFIYIHGMRVTHKAGWIVLDHYLFSWESVCKALQTNRNTFRSWDIPRFHLSRATRSLSRYSIRTEAYSDDCRLPGGRRPSRRGK